MRLLVIAGNKTVHVPKERTFMDVIRRKRWEPICGVKNYGDGIPASGDFEDITCVRCLKKLAKSRDRKVAAQAIDVLAKLHANELHEVVTNQQSDAQ